MLSKPFTEGKMKEVMTAIDGVTTFIPIVRTGDRQSVRYLEFPPLDLVAPSKLGACLEVLGNRGAVADIIALLVIGQASSRAIEEGGRGALGVATIVQQFASVLRNEVSRG